MNMENATIPDRPSHPARRTLSFDNNALVVQLYGEHNAHIRRLEELTEVSIFDRGNELTLEGAPDRVDAAAAILEALWAKLNNHQEVGMGEVDAAARFANSKEHSRQGKQSLDAVTDERTAIKTRKKDIFPRTPTQQKYISAIRSNNMVFGIGPAGTGKTYLAVAAAVGMFIDNEIERMVFCRPAVEAGERLGFLPGDLKDKVDPYLRPIYDALHDMMPADILRKKMEDGDIEIAPLAYMRGRTLHNAFVILDEAQNATPTQMKMFLTRMGEGSRMVITGDPTQTDLPKGTLSGLSDAMQVLDGVKGIEFVRFTGKDVVRHELVSRIVEAYDTHAGSKG